MSSSSTPATRSGSYDSYAGMILPLLVLVSTQSPELTTLPKGVASLASSQLSGRS